MILGAIVDAGASFHKIEEGLAKLGVAGYSISHLQGKRNGMRGTSVVVGLDASSPHYEHCEEFVSIIQQSRLPKKIIEPSCEVIRRLAKAENAVHGCQKDDAVLHELGDIDTLVDVVGTVIGLDLLDIDNVYSAALPAGIGMIKSSHGFMPLPSPATVELLAMSNIPVVRPPTNIDHVDEMITPTGVALLTTLSQFAQPGMTLERVGYGLGTRDSKDYPNVLGLWIGHEVDTMPSTTLTMIETNVDDISGEFLGYLHERLFELGALDVWFTSIQMKKNRPGTMISAIISSDIQDKAIKMVLQETSTFGVRVRPVSRYEACREVVSLDSHLGNIDIKIKWVDGDRVGVFPEYDSCRHIALKQGIPIQDVYRIAQQEAYTKFMKT
jgi:uncharacterized protein (TIGR00299 family) protein